MKYTKVAEGLGNLIEDAQKVFKQKIKLEDKLKAQRVIAELTQAMAILRRNYYEYDFIVESLKVNK